MDQYGKNNVLILIDNLNQLLPLLNSPSLLVPTINLSNLLLQSSSLLPNSNPIQQYLFDMLYLERKLKDQIQAENEMKMQTNISVIHGKINYLKNELLGLKHQIIHDNLIKDNTQSSDPKDVKNLHQNNEKNENEKVFESKNTRCPHKTAKHYAKVYL
jgi:hypothetical protein